MRVLRKVRLRLRSLFHRSAVECELDAELRFHLDQQIEENLVSGMTLAKRVTLRCERSEVLLGIRRNVAKCAV